MGSGKLHGLSHAAQAKPSTIGSSEYPDSPIDGRNIGDAEIGGIQMRGYRNLLDDYEVYSEGHDGWPCD